MPAQMYLIVTIRKPVADDTEAEQLYELVKQKLITYTGLKITGNVSNHFEPVEPVED